MPLSTTIKAMKILSLNSFFITTVIALTSVYSAKIQTTNQILTRVASKTITVLDVKKEMDRQIYMKDPNMFFDATAVGSYYYKNWKYTLQKITQDELFLLEADSLHYEIPAPDITQKVTQLFGENDIEAYKFLSITPEEGREIAKRELYSSHLIWFKVWNTSLMQTTPKAILGAYSSYIRELAKKDTWTYQALYLSSRNKEDLENTTLKLSTLLKESKCENLSLILDQVKQNNQEVKIGLSKDITLKTNELSPSLLAVLENLEEGMTSDIISGKNNGVFTGKILQLKEHKKERIPALSEVSEELKNTISSNIADQLSKEHFKMLYKQYDAEGLFGDDLFASKLEPFTLVDE